MNQPYKIGKRSVENRWGMRPLLFSCFLLVLLQIFFSGKGLATGSRTVPEQEVLYRSPTDMRISPDGRRLYVVCEGDNSLLVVDPEIGKVIGEVKVGHKPRSLALSPDGRTVYVSNEWSDTVSEIDVATLGIRRSLPTGWGPVGLATDAEGRTLYIANAIGNDISLIDLETGMEIKRLVAGRSPHYMLRNRDGNRIYVSNLLPMPAPPDQPPKSEVTVIDTRTQRVVERRVIPGGIALRHLAESPTGAWVMIPLLRPKNLNAMLQVDQGWVATHGFALLSTGPDRQQVQLLLDESDAYYADAFGAAFVPEAGLAFISSSSASIVSVIDFRRLDQWLREVPDKKWPRLGNRLDALSPFIHKRIPTGQDPRAIVVSPDGRFVYVANRLSDSISVVDVEKRSVIRTIDLGGPPELTQLRRGEILFHDASFCYQGQFACATCHPDNHIDGLVWDLEPDGLGRNRVENRTLRGIAETAPYKWTGKNPDLNTQCGPRVARFLFRSEGFNPEQLQDLVAFLKSIPLPPNRHLSPDGKLTEAQRRGKSIFEDRCALCHSGPHYTNQEVMFNGFTSKYDTREGFDVAQLDRIYESAPYMHNGRALTLEEIWTVYNPEDTHGVTNDLSKDELNDLIEYLKAL